MGSLLRQVLETEIIGGFTVGHLVLIVCLVATLFIIDDLNN